MLIKIHNGTPVHHADALCDTCRNATVMRGRRLDEQIVFCRGVSMEAVRITFTVIDCSDYQDERQPCYHELLAKAWILRPSTKRRAAGFVAPASWTRAKPRGYTPTRWRRTDAARSC